MTQTLWADCKALLVPALRLVIKHSEIIWRFAPGTLSLHQGHWLGHQMLHWVGGVTAQNVRIQEVILAQTPVCATHHLIICHRTNNWRGEVFVPKVTKWQYLLSEKRERIFLNLMKISLFHLSSVINKILIIGPFVTRVLLSKTRKTKYNWGFDFANPTKISPIKMKSSTTIIEYLPVGIAILEVKDVWINGTSNFLGSFYFAHVECVDDRNIFKSLLKLKKHLISIRFFRIPFFKGHYSLDN